MLHHRRRAQSSRKALLLLRSIFSSSAYSSSAYSSSFNARELDERETRATTTTNGEKNKTTRAMNTTTTTASAKNEHQRGWSLLYPSFQVWGSNTAVGKTLVSAALAKRARRANHQLFYLKPIQTGYPEDSDAKFVHEVAKSSSKRNSDGSLVKVTMRRNGITSGAHAAMCETNEEQKNEEQEDDVSIWCHTEFAWNVAAGPHLAEKTEGRPVSDEAVIDAIRSRLHEFTHGNNDCEKYEGEQKKFALIETAGGVASPSSSGNLQSNVLAKCRLPAILVGDGRLGGISVTVASYESLLLRGYDVACVVLSNEGYDNHKAIEENLPKNVKVFSIRKLPKEGDGMNWVHAQDDIFSTIFEHLQRWHAERVSKLNNLASEALESLWWPFTQHEMVQKSMVSVIDGRAGDDFVIYNDTTNTLEHRFDAAASWWTQGVTGDKANESLRRTLVHAAGRYGHVMAPENAHVPAVEAAKGILKGPAKSWGKRVFFSDNGSTATEVGIKMAFRQRYVNLGLLSRDGLERSKQANDIEVLQKLPKLRILALDGSYHGDTLGAMDMQSPSIFTGSLQTPWYEPRGLFLNAPTVALKNEKWTIECSDALVLSSTNTDKKIIMDVFDHKSDVFDMKKRKSSSSATRYEEIIDAVLDNAELLGKSGEAPEIGGLIMEPVLHGAAGMILIDPLFQSILMKKCKERKIPVVLDEVFAGIWRLGVEGAWELLDFETPDISCYAKLLTGGLVPMAATVTTEEIFNSFYGPGKPQALMHGHSYTAYPIGCAVTAQALKIYKDKTMNPNLPTEISSSSSSAAALKSSIKLNEMWDEETLKRISSLDTVERVISIGCVFAIELKVPSDSATGYASNIAKEYVLKLRKYGIQARPIGNVLYLMASPTTPKERCDTMLRALCSELNCF